ncbi:hypothetical protein LEP1GSC024_3018 [Leptospira noguchii str. 2001034031]|uniref:Uncharacterized protein n=1 Tax=Leptospira noguchii str. 2001034031 TaxID=1193053 RepID=M6YBY8_9LEPT|nr:hypothetical protein LEP1GSC024_3018 [Leptospira noguchii str. 2001034031]
MFKLNVITRRFPIKIYILSIFEINNILNIDKFFYKKLILELLKNEFFIYFYFMETVNSSSFVNLDCRIVQQLY